MLLTESLKEKKVSVRGSGLSPATLNGSLTSLAFPPTPTHFHGSPTFSKETENWNAYGYTKASWVSRHFSFAIVTRGHSFPWHTLLRSPESCFRAMILLQCEDHVVKTQRRSPVIKYSVSDKSVNQLRKPERHSEAAGEKTHHCIPCLSCSSDLEILSLSLQELVYVRGASIPHVAWSFKQVKDRLPFR